MAKYLNLPLFQGEQIVISFLKFSQGMRTEF